MSEDKTTVEVEMENEQENADVQEGTDVNTEAAGVDLAAEVERWKAAAEEHQNRYLRAMADMENMRKRMRKEQEDLAQYASQKVITELLSALDNFERALSADKESLTVEALLQGVSMVHRQIMQVFEKEGLVPIDAVGKPFDPNLHQAVMQVEDSSQESGVVLEEFQKGYLFKDRVIRPSMVKVNS